MRLEIKSGIKPGQEVFTGFAGQYLTAPEDQGTYTLYELVYESQDGQLRHDDFVFEAE